jgi:hypothetical protein
MSFFGQALNNTSERSEVSHKEKEIKQQKRAMLATKALRQYKVCACF